jgi:hypothetical protein
MLAVDEEALRHDQMEVILCTGHGDIEQSPFLLGSRPRCRYRIGEQTSTTLRR